MKKRALSIFLVLAMMMSLIPGMSFAASAAESIAYISRTWDGEKVVETEKECADYIVVDANTTTFEDGKWYVVNGEVTISGRIVVSGTANLILCDGCTLNANSGIQLFEGNALNIYGQSADSGKLNAKASYLGNSGIGGNQNDGNGGDLTVYGGSIYASGATNAAGIGGGWYTGGGSFTMYGGSVEAKAYNQYAAGIGKGRNGSQGSFTVYGTPHVYAGDTAPGSETTVAGYQSSRNSYVNIIYTGHIHTWLDATCTEPQTCSECGEKVGSPLGHTWVKGNMVSEATCTQPAVYRYECSICHETKNDEFGGKTAHHFVNNVCTECRVEEFVIDESGCLTGYNGNGGDVVIPEGVTSIGDFAFYDCSSLTEVTIPESVTSIGDFAFYDCSSLTEVTIPEGVTSIRSHTFTHCSALTKVTIPEGVTSIGVNAFFDCTALTKVTIPESITSIGESAFGACIYLETVTISDNIKSVGEYAFPGSIRTVNYPCGDDLDIIKAYFGGEVWSGITYNVFHDYSARGTLVSAATCTESAVYEAKCVGCNLVSGTMKVGEPLGHTFENGVCTECGEHEKAETYIDRTWDGEKVAETGKECADYIVVDANTTTFENGKWYVVNGEVTVSGRIVVSGTANLILCDDCILNANSGIQLFEGNALNIYGQSADSGKLNAKASYLGNSGIGGNQNNGNGGDLTVYGGSIYASGRSNAAGIGGGWLTSGGSFTMYGGSVEAKAGNQYAAGIGKGFGGSDGNLTVYGTPHVYAGDTAPDIETTVAGYESSRNSYVKIIYSNHVHTWLDATCTEPKTCSECGEKIGSPLGHTWVKGDMVSEATCTQPAVYRYECSLCHETKNDVYGGKTAHNFVDNVCTECRVEEFVIDESGCLTGYNGNGGDVVIPEGVTSIGGHAFERCSSLTEVTIPEGVTSIGGHAFESCSSLTEVTIPESVTSIGYSAFCNCSELQTVTITDNIKSVEGYFFDGANIRTVNYPCGDDLDIIKAYFGGADLIDTTYNAFHVYSAQGTLVSAATCTESAVYEAKCVGCVLVSGTMKVGSPLGHTWQDANCTTPKTCSVCGETEGEALGHTWQDANCTTPKTCSVCGETEGEALGHAYELNSKGKAKCKRCSDILPAPKDSENLNSSAINVGDIIKSGTVITPDDNRSESYMGVFVDGKDVGVYTPYKKYTAPTCLKCVSKSTVDRYGNYEIYFETACPYSEATCTEPSTCLYCGHTKGEPLGHNFESGVCTVCGERNKISGISVKNGAQLTDDEKMIYGLACGLNSAEDYFEITDNTLSLSNDKAVIGTGTHINVLKDGEIATYYEAVIFGDVNGDGWYDGMDAIIVNCLVNGLLAKEQIGEAEYMAADCNHDGVIDVNDAAILEQAGVLLAQVDQSKSEEELLETSSAYVQYLNLIDQSVETETTEPAEDEPVDPGYTFNFFDKIVEFIKEIIIVIRTVIAYLK